MLKGYINYNEKTIAFVIKDYCLELFSDDSPLISQFCHDYNFKVNYILEGTDISAGSIKRKIYIYVDHSIGAILYVNFYIIANNEKITFDKICLESRTLDSIFRYKYNLIEKVRQENINFYSKQQSIYCIPFEMNDINYLLDYKMGYNEELGFLDDTNRCGEVSIDLVSKNLEECYNIVVLVERFMKFMSQHFDVKFKNISLKNQNGLKEAFIYYPLLSNIDSLDIDFHFFKFDVEKYTSKILSNIALNTGMKIEKSIPVFHIKNFDNVYTTNRFLNQINAFEYLFDKIDHEKAQDSRFSLKLEIEEMLKEFVFILLGGEDISNVANDLKELRRTIVHGYEYYYGFENDPKISRNINILDDLLVCMSLKVIGFDKAEIEQYFVRY